MITKREQLRDRVEARKHELMAKYNELKADGRQEASEARTRLKQRLDELEADLKTGWDNMSEAVAAKIDKWLDRKDDDDRVK
jgi:hypothetical protein